MTETKGCLLIVAGLQTKSENFQDIQIKYEDYERNMSGRLSLRSKTYICIVTVEFMEKMTKRKKHKNYYYDNTRKVSKSESHGFPD